MLRKLTSERTVDVDASARCSLSVPRTSRSWGPSFEAGAKFLLAHGYRCGRSLLNGVSEMKCRTWERRFSIALLWLHPE